MVASVIGWYEPISLALLRGMEEKWMFRRDEGPSCFFCNRNGCAADLYFRGKVSRLTRGIVADAGRSTASLLYVHKEKHSGVTLS